MPGFGGSLSERDIASLVAYLRRLQGRDPSATALPDGDGPPQRDPREERGRALFFGRARCAECHARGDEGALHGPDLSDLASRLSRDAVLEAIVDPSASIAEGYGAMVLVTRDGRTLRGLTRNVTAETLQLLDESGELWTTWRRDALRSAEPDPRSLMPEGLLDPLSESEVEDLLHYLAR